MLKCVATCNTRYSASLYDIVYLATKSVLGRVRNNIHKVLHYVVHELRHKYKVLYMPWSVNMIIFPCITLFLHTRLIQIDTKFI